ncbi:HupE/UreJ family protein [Vibrio tapetis subsp. quintayensis]|uniref:HupE/UreJ family protein n=1 Tax=Vibrio tapetis TaxID=52443 RepID=UPI0025B39159|nr:HupE/UreJ family protein [Vibrio tapetis]MDN3678779.1 HupE/UreJ family protein [Vibrio tapetis subsp. quintayensis]
MKKSSIQALAITAVFTPQLALAHVGDHGLINSFSQGFLHPIFGLDHLLVLLAMGVVAQQAASKKGKALIVLGVIGSMFLGTMVGKIAGAVSGLEFLILGSAFVAAGTIWKARNSSSALTNALMSLSISLVLFHGWAHGAELHGAALMQFIPGMLLSSSLLLFVGYQSATFIPKKVIAGIVASSGLFLALLG